MKYEILNNAFNAAVTQFQNSEQFLVSSHEFGSLFLEEEEDFWKKEAQLALSVLLAHFLCVSKDVRLEAFVSFINNLTSLVPREELNQVVKKRFRNEAERFLMQSPLTMRASVEVLQENIRRVDFGFAIGTH